jgi:phosphopantetheine adenylyltransferase
MSDDHDDRAMMVLEKAVYRAQELLEKTQKFQPFLMILDNDGSIETVENAILDSMESYTLLGDVLKERIKEGGVDVMVMVVDTLIPENFVQDVPSSIRLHLEEKSQIDKSVAARFLYVPYTLHKVEEEIFMKLHTPIPVGFPAEYIVKDT